MYNQLSFQNSIMPRRTAQTYSLINVPRRERGLVNYIGDMNKCRGCYERCNHFCYKSDHPSFRTKFSEVNGQDLSNSSHNEAVEVFRKATEPIVVEVLRRVKKGVNRCTAHTHHTVLNRAYPTSADLYVSHAASTSSSSWSSSSSCSSSLYSVGYAHQSAMASIATQTGEDFFCYNRPLSPPPAFSHLTLSGLYQPSSRRPVAFSPTDEMGLTDIETCHALDVDEPFFDDRQCEMVYEEVVLHRRCDEKLGLTLCYGSLEEEFTEILISEIDSSSVAGRDGHLKEGDQVLQTDDGSTDEPNAILDDLVHVDLLEQHHQDNMYFVTSILDRAHLDEESVTTDTSRTDNSRKRDKDSGLGKTDESTRNEESSEQELFDDNQPINVCEPSDLGGNKDNSNLLQTFLDEPFNDLCRKEYDDGTHFHGSNDNSSLNAPEKNVTCGTCRHLADDLKPQFVQVVRKMDEIQIGGRENADLHHVIDSQKVEARIPANYICDNFPSSRLAPGAAMRTPVEHQRSPRVFPRMGTKLDTVKHLQTAEQIDLCSQQRQSAELNCVSGIAVNNCKSAGSETVNCRSEQENDKSATDAHTTSGEQCLSPPLTLELNAISDESEKGLKNPKLRLPSPYPTTPVSSDTEKQTQTPVGEPTLYETTKESVNIKGDNLPVCSDVTAGGPAGDVVSLQDEYLRSANVMYTNHANLQHTIDVQQKIFQQQLCQQKYHRSDRRPVVVSTSHTATSSPDGTRSLTVTSTSTGDAQQQSPCITAPSDGGGGGGSDGRMEWVIKRRPDGTRYVTRRPVRSRILKERAKKIAEERSGLTTDDDAMSELKVGRYWTRDERKRQLEKAKDDKRRKEKIMKQRLETLKESEERKEVNIVEMSHRKMNRHKNRKIIDNFVTVQEVLAHGTRNTDGKVCCPLLSVTTV